MEPRNSELEPAAPMGLPGKSRRRVGVCRGSNNGCLSKAPLAECCVRGVSLQDMMQVGQLATMEEDRGHFGQSTAMHFPAAHPALPYPPSKCADQ